MCEDPSDSVVRLEALRLALSNPVSSSLSDEDLIKLAGKYFAFLSGRAQEN